MWVDDLVSFTNSPAESDHVEEELESKFKIKTLGKPSLLLGMKISRNKELKIITLSQTHYIHKILEQVRLQDANSVTTPIDPSINLEFNEKEHDWMIDNRASGTYAKAIGSLMYAAIGTQPDIAYAVHTLAKFTRSPQSQH